MNPVKKSLIQCNKNQSATVQKSKKLTNTPLVFTESLSDK